MSPELNHPSTSHFLRQQGAGLPMAIFLITVMALIVATIAQLQQTSGESQVLDVLSTRAFYAAESGAQLGTTEILQAGTCDLSSPYPLSAGLNGCRAEVSCQAQGVSGEGDLFLIRSQGICTGGGDNAIRTIEVVAQ